MFVKGKSFISITGCAPFAFRPSKLPSLQLEERSSAKPRVSPFHYLWMDTWKGGNETKTYDTGSHSKKILWTGHLFLQSWVHGDKMWLLADDRGLHQYLSLWWTLSEGSHWIETFVKQGVQLWILVVSGYCISDPNLEKRYQKIIGLVCHGQIVSQVQALSIIHALFCSLVQCPEICWNSLCGKKMVQVWNLSTHFMIDLSCLKLLKYYLYLSTCWRMVKFGYIYSRSCD